MQKFVAWFPGVLLSTLALSFFFASPARAATATVPVGANIQSYVNANPAGTTYQLSAGTYSGQTVTPKSGDVYLGAPNLATILDGGGGTAEHHAFTPGS